MLKGTELTLANIIFGNNIISEVSFKKWNQNEAKNSNNNKEQKKINNSNKNPLNTEAKVIGLLWLFRFNDYSIILLKSVNNIKGNFKVYKSKEPSVVEFQSKILPTRIENEATPAATPAEITKKKEVKLPAG